MDCAVCGEEVVGNSQSNIHSGCASRKSSSKGKSLYQVSKSLDEAISSDEYSSRDKGSKQMSTLTIKSNYARDRVVTFGDLVLRFNGQGIAKVPSHQRSVIQAEMRVRPGRYTIVEAAPVTAPTPAPAPAPVVEAAPEPAPVEEEVEEKVEEVVAETKTAKRAKAPKKTTKSKAKKVVVEDSTDTKENE